LKNRTSRTYKSLLERDFATNLDQIQAKFQYEPDKIPYIRPSTYTPDWKISKDVYLETKGKFTAAQRHNLLAFIDQHPKTKIIMVFSQAKNKINKKSKMTYEDWCIKNNITYFNLNAYYDNKTRSYRFKTPMSIKWIEKQIEN
jgi:hypothetical protein